MRYVIKARFDLTESAAPSDNNGKFSDIIRRRLEGQFYSMPCPEGAGLPAVVTPWTGDESPETQTLAREALPGNRELETMLYDLDYSDPANITPMYFMPSGRPSERLRRGVYR